MNPEAIIAKICSAIDLLIESSKPYKGLFPSILDAQIGDMPKEKPPKIPGQRDGDRAHLGSNLIHDEPLLATMNALAESHSKPEYIEAVDRYLEHFAQKLHDGRQRGYSLGVNIRFGISLKRALDVRAIQQG